MGAVNGIYLPIHKHDRIMRLQKIKKIIESRRCATKMLTLMLVEVIFLLEFYYLYSWDILEAWCLHVDTQSSIKGINIEGCKIPIAWAIKQKEHKAVKQHSGPTIYLGKDDESKLITM